MGQSSARPWVFAALAFFMPALLVAGSGQSPWVQLLCVGVSAGVGSALLLWLWREPAFEATPLAFILLLALLLRGSASFAAPLLEDDYFRYLWDGYQTVTTGNPYRQAPADFFLNRDLAPAWQAVLSGINYPDIPTIYGPVLQLLFAVAYDLAPGELWAVKCLLLLADMATLLVLARSGVKVRWLLAYAVHPLLLKEVITSAHPDSLVGLFLLLAALSWRRRWPCLVGASLALSVATKVAAMVALPLLILSPPAVRSVCKLGSSWRSGWRWAWRVGLAFCAGLLCLYLPFLLQGSSDWLALRKFGDEWRFNPLMFRLVEVLLPSAWVRPVSGGLVVVGVAALAWWWRRPPGGRGFVPTLPVLQNSQALAPIAGALTLLLFLSPVVNPWYWLWALGPAVLLGNGIVLAVASVAWVSYLISHHVWGLVAPHSILPWAVALTQGLVVLGVAVLRPANPAT
jgi:hypothetical protein